MRILQDCDSVWFTSFDKRKPISEFAKRKPISDKDHSCQNNIKCGEDKFRKTQTPRY